MTARCAQAQPDFVTALESPQAAVRAAGVAQFGAWASAQAQLGEVAACERLLASTPRRRENRGRRAPKGSELFSRDKKTHSPDSPGKTTPTPITDPDPADPLQVDLTVDGASTQPAIRQLPASSRCIS